jgi:uncharacterized membrane protein YgcG
MDDESEPKARERYAHEPEVALPSMVSPDPLARKRKRRSTMVKARRSRRYRWWVVGGFAIAIVLLSFTSALIQGTWLFLLTGVAMAAVTCTTQYLAESDIALARARSKAVEREMRAAKRELAILHGYFAQAHNAIARANPAVADEMLASMNVDLMRSRLTTRRIESDA